MSTYDLFNEVNDLMTLGFGRPMNVKFSTGATKDMMPSYWTKWYLEKELKPATSEQPAEIEKIELGYKCVARTVGINPEDIKITLEDYGLLLEGETEVEDSTYSQHIEMPISKEVLANLDKIDYKTENGLTRIYLTIKEPEYKKVSINQL